MPEITVQVKLLQLAKCSRRAPVILPMNVTDVIVTMNLRVYFIDMVFLFFCWFTL